MHPAQSRAFSPAQFPPDSSTKTDRHNARRRFACERNSPRLKSTSVGTLAKSL
jgi:hypothetical protein